MKRSATERFFHAVGYYGPITLFVVLLLALALLPTAPPLPVYRCLLIVIIFQVFSYYFNVVLKNTFQLPRPAPYAAQVKLAELAPYWTKHIYYGMPSGHVQAVFGQMTFLLLYLFYFVGTKTSSTTTTTTSLVFIIAIFAVLQAFITAWQRYADHRHTALQILAGAGIGIGLAFAIIIML